MSSNQKHEKIRTTSTARRLNRLWVVRLLGVFFLIDIVCIIVAGTAWNYFGQIREFHTFSISNQILLFQQLKQDPQKIVLIQVNGEEQSFYIRKYKNENTMQYVVNDHGEERVSDITVIIQALLTCYIVLLVIEIIIVFHQALFGIFAVRRKLRSLDQMAFIANELGSQAEMKQQDGAFHFDEQKVHSLEDAIARITPDGPEKVLHTSDAELKGLEFAINGLLERMRAAYKQQSRFVSDASHELRTPIAVIQGYVNMLDRWGKDDPKVLSESIDAIKHESDHMKKLVEQLLFLARGDSGRNKFVLERTDLNEVVKEVYEESLMIDENHIYHCEYSATSNYVYADSAMLKQAVRILVDNAAKYTNAHEQIRIGCGIDNEIPFIYVQDNGIGMNGEQASHVFERFYRADNARDSKTGGTGLGLSIAKWIIDRHGGYFKIISYEDIGSRISVYLPQQEVKKEWETIQKQS